MEVGQHAPASQHYPKRWDSDRDSFYPDNLRERKLSSAGGSWNFDSGYNHSIASSPSSLSSLLPSTGPEGNVDKVLYQSLVEMFPLVETFMDQQNSKSFPRHASMIYTPTPSRDALPLKKMVEPFQRGKKGRGQLARGKKGDFKEGLFWDSAAENAFSDSRELYSDEIPMLPFSTGLDVDQTAINKAKHVQLQSYIEQLELKLQEKDSQLQAAEEASQQTELLQLQGNIDELQKQISLKEWEIQKAQDQLSEKQHEVADLQSLLEKAEADVEESNVKASKVQEELNSMRCQVAALLIQIKNITTSFDDEQADKMLTSTDELAMDEPVNAPDPVAEEIEVTRRKYLAALIAAKENPNEEFLTLVSELRLQLHTYLLRPEAANAASCLLDVQSSKFSIC